MFWRAAVCLITVAVACSLACPLFAIAQTTAPSSQEEPTLTLHVTAQLVLVDASVQLRKTGTSLQGLTAADFLLTEDGTLQTITSLSEDQLPLSLVLLFDLTDTVHPVLQHLSNGAAATLRHLRPQDEVAVMTFSSHTTLLQPFTRDRMSAVEGIDAAAASYDAQEPTFLFEDLWQATAQSRQARVPTSRRVQIWLTDGSANDQDMQRGLARHAPALLHSEEEASTALLQANTVVSALIEHGPVPVHTGRPGERFGDIEHYAERTGGPVLFATEGNADAQLASLLDTLRQRYTLGYRPAVPRPEGTVCHLQLALSPAFFAAHPNLKPRDVLLRTRQSYRREASAP